jgi:hypothetical protein
VRFDAHFEGRVVEGELTGVTVTGVDSLRFRADGVGVLDACEVIMPDGDCVEVRIGGYCIPPAGVTLPSPEIMLAPDFEWPEVELPLHGYATFATGAQPWQHLNHTVGTFNGIANPGAGTLLVEAHALVPETIAARIAS